MVILGGIIGAVVALAVVVVPVEWIDPDAVPESLEVVLSVLIAAVGAFAGSRIVRRLAHTQARRGLG